MEMTDVEIYAARDALRSWFESQEIDPGQAGVVMSTLIAEQLVRKTRNQLALLEAVAIFRGMLLVDVAGELRK